MRAMMIIVLIVALAAAGSAAYLVSDYLARQRELASQDTEQLPTFTGQRVMVADREIEAGATMRDSMVRWQPWPPEDIRSGYKVIGSIEGETEAQVFSQRNRLEQGINGKIARRPIAPGEPITDAMLFNRADAGFMAGALEPGKVAISIEVTPATGGVGFIKPGDRVNVMLTHDLRDTIPQSVMSQAGLRGVALRHVSETVVESVRVLGVDQTFSNNEDDPEEVDTVTVEVDPSQAETIALAEVMGDVTVVLRGLSETEKPVGLAALLGLDGPSGPMGRPVVGDRGISPGIASMIDIAQSAAEQSGDIANLREMLEDQREAQRRLEDQLDQERAERARLIEELRRPDRATQGTAPPAPTWSVTVHRVREDEIETETVGESPEEDMDAAAPGSGPSAPATAGALPGDDIPPDEILIQE